MNNYFTLYKFASVRFTLNEHVCVCVCVVQKAIFKKYIFVILYARILPQNFVVKTIHQC